MNRSGGARRGQHLRARPRGLWEAREPRSKGGIVINCYPRPRDASEGW